MQTRRRPAVLVVEDSEEIRNALSWMLTDEGYEVRTAPNGQEALTLLSDWLPDVVITDLEMPVLDGRSFLAEFRERSRGSRTPVIVYSGAPNPQALAQELDADDAICKPAWNDLLYAVRQFTHTSARLADDWTDDQRVEPQAAMDWTSDPAAISVAQAHELDELDWTADDIGPFNPQPFTMQRYRGLVTLFPEGPQDPNPHTRAA